MEPYDYKENLLGGGVTSVRGVDNLDRRDTSEALQQKRRVEKEAQEAESIPIVGEGTSNRTDTWT